MSLKTFLLVRSFGSGEPKPEEASQEATAYGPIALILMMKKFYEFFYIFQLADPSENDTDMIAPLLGYAKPGAVNGTLLYVNYGRTEDFEVLRNNLSIPNCNGKIVIMRYGKIYRGDKVKGREGKGREGKGREGKGREGKGREGKGREGKGREGKGREGYGYV